MVGVDVPGGLFDRGIIDDDTGVPLSDFKALMNGTMVLVSNHTTGVTSPETLYTVPAGKTFYLVSVNSLAYNSIANAADSQFDANIGAGAVSMISHRFFNNANFSESIVLTFPIPIKFPTGTVFRTLIGGGAAANNQTDSIMGYLV